MDSSMVDGQSVEAQPAQKAPPLPDVTAAIGALWDRFKGVAFDRVEAVEAAVVAQLEGRLDGDEKRRAEREAHKLAGSVGTFGFAEGSRIAREIEMLLQSPLGQAETLRLSDLSVALRATLERSETRGQAGHANAARRASSDSPPAPAPKTIRDLRPLMLIIDSDAEFARQLGEDAETRRMRHRIATDAEEVRAALTAEAPDVVVLDLQFGGAPERGLALIAEVARCAPRARTLVVSATGSYEERLEVARRGGRAFIQKPAAPARVLEAAVEMLGTADGAIRRVLVVDDDPALLGMVVEQLRGPRLEVATLDNPLHFWETLERTRPDVLLIDENMPMLSGSELCAVLRGDPRWAGLPVLFITASADVETVRRVFAAGADDYVSKPFAGPELRTRIEGRVERHRLQRVIAEQDPLTGVANRRMTGSMLEQLVTLAPKQRQPVSIALIDMDGLGEVNDVHGETTGDIALRSVAGLLAEAMRGDEALGRWSGDAFLAGFSTDAEEAAGRLRLVLERLRAGGLNGNGSGVSVSFSAGVASSPADGHDLRTLVLSARQALSDAREQGAGVIATTGRSSRDPSTTEMVDVVLVEDDIALSGLLGHTLETRGHSTRVISDGGEAIAALCGPSPRLRARVIILDVDLPGRDGFEVLRSLARDNVTAHSRVVMLTVRATEPEVVRALELGAFDHIAKPFSVQILMQRLRRALGE